MQTHLRVRFSHGVVVILAALSSHAHCEERWKASSLESGMVTAAVLNHRDNIIEWRQNAMSSILAAGGKVIFESSGGESFKYRDVVMSPNGEHMAVRVMKEARLPGGINFSRILLFFKSRDRTWLFERDISAQAFPAEVFSVTEIGAVSNDAQHLLLHIGERHVQNESATIGYYWQTWNVIQMRMIGEGLSIW